MVVEYFCKQAAIVLLFLLRLLVDVDQLLPKMTWSFAESDSQRIRLLRQLKEDQQCIRDED